MLLSCTIASSSQSMIVTLYELILKPKLHSKSLEKAPSRSINAVAKSQHPKALEAYCKLLDSFILQRLLCMRLKKPNTITCIQTLPKGSHLKPIGQVDQYTVRCSGRPCNLEAPLVRRLALTCPRTHHKHATTKSLH